MVNLILIKAFIIDDCRYMGPHIDYALKLNIMDHPVGLIVSELLRSSARE